MAVVTVLNQDDVVRLDPDRLTELYVRLGEAGAEDAICQAMEELATQLTDMHEVAPIAGTDLLQNSAQNIAEMAAHIGMSSLSRVAMDVQYCLQINDGPAISATMARMMRIGERSLTTVWDNRDLSV